MNITIDNSFLEKIAVIPKKIDFLAEELEKSPESIFLPQQLPMISMVLKNFIKESSNGIKNEFIKQISQTKSINESEAAIQFDELLTEALEEINNPIISFFYKIDTNADYFSEIVQRTAKTFLKNMVQFFNYYSDEFKDIDSLNLKMAEWFSKLLSEKNPSIPILFDFTDIIESSNPERFFPLLNSVLRNYLLLQERNGAIHIDSGLFLNLNSYMPILISKLVDEFNITAYKDFSLVIDNKIERIVKISQSDKARKNAIKKNQILRSEQASIRQQALELFTDLAYKDKYHIKGQKPFARHFALKHNNELMRHNPDIAEKDLLKESTVLKWIQDYLAKR